MKNEPKQYVATVDGYVLREFAARNIKEAKKRAYRQFGKPGIKVSESISTTVKEFPNE